MLGRKEAEKKNKKPYETPKAERLEFDWTRVTACSGVAPATTPKPGHGWGDKNHEHTHWKDGGY